MTIKKTAATSKKADSKTKSGSTRLVGGAIEKPTTKGKKFEDQHSILKLPSFGTSTKNSSNATLKGFSTLTMLTVNDYCHRRSNTL